MKILSVICSDGEDLSSCGPWTTGETGRKAGVLFCRFVQGSKAYIMNAVLLIRDRCCNVKQHGPVLPCIPCSLLFPIALESESPGGNQCGHPCECKWQVDFTQRRGKRLSWERRPARKRGAVRPLDISAPLAAMPFFALQALRQSLPETSAVHECQ